MPFYLATYQFGMFKLLDHPPGSPVYKEKSDNPFSLIMEAAWHHLHHQKAEDDEILKTKVTLIRKLLESGWSKETIRVFLILSNTMFPLRSPNEILNLRRQFHQLKTQKIWRYVK